MSGAGDVNGDGRDDVIIGAILADNNGRSVSGSSYVFYTGETDVTAPVLSCGVASSQWLDHNASILCTASDSGSGLANPSQAALTLTTNVAAGAENANASTNSVLVCDVAGNCATAGPVAANKIDRKAPTITLSTPAR